MNIDTCTRPKHNKSPCNGYPRPDCPGYSNWISTRGIKAIIKRFSKDISLALASHSSISQTQRDLAWCLDRITILQVHNKNLQTKINELASQPCKCWRGHVAMCECHCDCHKYT
jgi:hypothetical protein